MAQKEQQQPGGDQSAPEPTDPEVRATIEATQKALEQSAAEIERAKRLRLWSRICRITNRGSPASTIGG